MSIETAVSVLMADSKIEFDTAVEWFLTWATVASETLKFDFELYEEDDNCQRRITCQASFSDLCNHLARAAETGSWDGIEARLIYDMTEHFRLEEDAEEAYRCHKDERERESDRWGLETSRLADDLFGKWDINKSGKCIESGGVRAGRAFPVSDFVVPREQCVLFLEKTRMEHPEVRVAKKTPSQSAGVANEVKASPIAAGAKGGRAKRYDEALQRVIDHIHEGLQASNKRLDITSLLQWFEEHDKPWESPVSGCDELCIDGKKLAWTDRKGKERSIAFRSLERYYKRAREHYSNPRTVARS